MKLLQKALFDTEQAICKYSNLTQQNPLVLISLPKDSSFKL